MVVDAVTYSGGVNWPLFVFGCFQSLQTILATLRLLSLTRAGQLLSNKVKNNFPKQLYKNESFVFRFDWSVNSWKMPIPTVQT